MLDTIQVVLGDDEIELKLGDIIPIGEDLSGEFAHQSSLYAYVALLTARAEAEWLFSKKELERSYAEVDGKARRDMDAHGTKVTEDKVKAYIRLNEDYQDGQEWELEMREQYLILKAITKAMDMRAQMLISLGAHLRTEFQQTGMNIGDVKAMITTSLKSNPRGTQPSAHSSSSQNIKDD